MFRGNINQLQLGNKIFISNIIFISGLMIKLFVISWFFITLYYFMIQHQQTDFDVSDLVCSQENMLEYTFGAFADDQCLKQIPLTRKIIILIYFSFTTLSTVGLGDFHPRSSFERLLIVPAFLFGVLAQAIISGIFLEVAQKISEQNKEGFEDLTGLNKFL